MLSQWVLYFFHIIHPLYYINCCHVPLLMFFFIRLSYIVFLFYYFIKRATVWPYLQHIIHLFAIEFSVLFLQFKIMRVFSIKKSKRLMSFGSKANCLLKVLLWVFYLKKKYLHVKLFWGNTRISKRGQFGGPQYKNFLFRGLNICIICIFKRKCYILNGKFSQWIKSY